ncbi:MAG: FprA family A-type flavoprotein [Parachlamydiales bacterium]|nr:FprA family A-type flavoprotein [Parachlamydiales bacterium]
MKAFEIKKGIYWVGAIDWDLREFHGYQTQRGSTYNAYLIIDDKITLVDTVKHYLFDEMLERIKSIIDPAKIDYVVSNHSEMDHSGALPDIMNICKNATVICSPNGKDNLEKHFDVNSWKFKIVNTSDEINIGKHTLFFVLMQMVHWPDSMATFIKDEKLLLPNDAFGQHIASYERFADELGLDIVFEEAKKYFANIILPYSRQASKAVSEIDKLDIDMIAPSHGLIWKGNVNQIIKAYKSWDANETKEKAIILFDTMWGSTRKMALAIYKAFEEKNIHVEFRNIKTTHISDIMTHLIDSKYICIGSPTLNNTCLPTIASVLNYIKGLNPKNRLGLVFGSYGWGGQAINEIETAFKELSYTIIDTIKVQYVPSDEYLNKMKDDLKNKLP